MLAEFLVYFYKTALDRPMSLLNAEDIQFTLKILVRALKDHSIHTKDKEELLEVMEIITLFTCNF